MDLFVYALFRLFIWVVTRFPYTVQVQFFAWLARTVFFLKPKYRAISFFNLERAYPGQRALQETIYQKTPESLGVLIADFLRTPQVDQAWCDAHIDSEQFRTLSLKCTDNRKKGYLLVTGHLGSFELFGQILALIWRPIHPIARPFKSPRIDTWWSKRRAINGNTVIYREGAYREMIRVLKGGEEVGVLFDQNVTRANAVFVDWFGTPAATTKAIGAAAVSTGAPIITCALLPQGQGRYVVVAEEVSTQEVLNNPALSKSDKIVEITRRAVLSFEQMIRKHPQSWFWFHRRWKTRPEGEVENLYAEY
jgi:KDO2-lipid IV(A) lauroyltransferase